VRLFRQSRRGEWGDVIERVARALRQLGSDGAGFRALERVPRIGDGEASRDRASPPWPPPADRPPFSAVAETRVGIVQYLPQDAPVGESIRWYGEYLQPQLDVLWRLVPPGATVLEVDAGVGVHALALARAAGEEGHAMLYEGRPLHRRILQQNLVANGIMNVTLMRRQLGPLHEAARDLETLDDLELEQLTLLKTNDVERGASVIDGAAQTLWRSRPSLFMAAADGTALRALSQRVREFGYRTWSVSTALFNPDNFNRRSENVFGHAAALALLAIPEESGVDVSLDRFEELR
jgi:hypothetical protein